MRGAALGAEMEDERARVGAREEVLPEKRHKHKRQKADHEKDGDEEEASSDQPAKQALVAVAYALEAPLKPALELREKALRWPGVVVMRLQEIHRQRRHQRSRKDVGREHGKDDRLGEWDEEVSRDTAQEEHRQKHDADAKGRDEGGNGDLRCAFKDGVVAAADPPRGSARCSRW